MGAVTTDLGIPGCYIKGHTHCLGIPGLSLEGEVVYIQLYKTEGNYWVATSCKTSRNMLNQQMFLVFWCIK